MGWLRRDKDCIALVVVWALLLQAAILSVTSSAHAATLATENVVLCTLRGALIGDPSPGESHRQTDHLLHDVLPTGLWQHGSRHPSACPSRSPPRFG